jgi:hypothetical protein
MVALALAPLGVAADGHLDRPVAAIEQLLGADTMRIVSARKSRPKVVADITLRGDAVFGEGDSLHVKIRPAARGGSDFNNEPRYEVAAYRLQSLFLDPEDYVVPPTALRTLTPAELAPYSDAGATFRAADDIVCVIQAWLKDVTNPADVLDKTRLEREPEYARQIGNLNIFTVAINHLDSNRGNFLISRNPPPRLFSVDNGVAFASPSSNRGEVWRRLRVKQLPAATVERLRHIAPEHLDKLLGVIAEWRVVNRSLVAHPAGDNINPTRAVRYRDDIIQLGLTRNEIRQIDSRIRQIVKQIDRGRVSTF